MISLEEIEQIEQMMARLSAGPWEVGTRYSRSEVNDGFDPILEVGKCWCCNSETPLVCETKEDGKVYHIHKHSDQGNGCITSSGDFKNVVGKGGVANDADAEFIAQARSLIPRLCSTLKSLLDKS